MDRKPIARFMVQQLLRVPLGLLVAVAGLFKLFDISVFARTVGEFGVVHDALVLPTAWIVSLIEILTGLGLAANVRCSLSAMFMLLLTFIGVLTYGIGLGLDIDCGCLGPGYHVSLRTQLLIDAGLVLCCGLVYWTRRECGPQPDGLLIRLRRVLNIGSRTE